MSYYLDTNIIIYTLKDSYPAIKDHFLKVPLQTIRIPEIVMGEIEYGAYKSKDYDKTIKTYKGFTNYFDKAIFDDEAARWYGDIRRNLEKKGEIIGPNDLIIASIVLANNGILVTHNVKEFSRIDYLRIEDWTV